MKTTKKWVPVVPAAAQLEQLGAALAGLRATVPELITLGTAEKRALQPLGPRSASACRALIDFMADHPDMVPPGVDLEYVRAAQVAIAGLREALAPLALLARFMRDTEHALGAYVRAAAMDAYALLKRSGEAHGYHDLLRQIRSQMHMGKRPARTAAASPAPAAGA